MLILIRLSVGCDSESVKNVKQNFNLYLDFGNNFNVIFGTS
jgi:hypothetical protein